MVMSQRNHGIKVLGVSADGVKSHDKFASKFDLPFALLADEDKEVINKFGVWGPKSLWEENTKGFIEFLLLLTRKG